MCLNLLGIAIDIGISYTHFSEDNGMNIIAGQFVHPNLHLQFSGILCLGAGYTLRYICV